MEPGSIHSGGGFFRLFTSVQTENNRKLNTIRFFTSSELFAILQMQIFNCVIRLMALFFPLIILVIIIGRYWQVLSGIDSFYGNVITFEFWLVLEFHYYETWYELMAKRWRVEKGTHFYTQQ